MNGQATADRRVGSDRRVKRRFRYPERRHGFDRRKTHAGPAAAAYHRMLAAYRRNPRVLALVLIIVATLNVADLVLTLRAVDLGAVEVNPIMAALIDADRALAAVFKVSIGLAVVAVIWAMRRYRRILEMSLVLFGGFMLLFVYSLSIAALLPG